MEQLISQREKLSRPAQIALKLYSCSPDVANSRAQPTSTSPQNPSISKVSLSHDRGALTIVCISDTHDERPEIPPGDVLIHAGDLTQHGWRKDIQAQLDWLSTQPHTYKIAIAGNHDVLLDPACHDPRNRFFRESEEAEEQLKSLNFGSVIYLNNTSTKLSFPNGRTLNIYGSPQTPAYGYPAFQHKPTVDVWENSIPNDTDIVISHGPPRCHLDSHPGGRPFLAGSYDLLRELRRVKPKLMICGHIHEGYGTDTLFHDDAGVQALTERFLAEKKMGWGSVFALLGRLVLSWIRSGVRGYGEHLVRGFGAGINMGAWRIEGKARAKAREKDREGDGKRRGKAEVKETILVNAALEASRRDPRVKKPVVVVL